jgi:hypothetical protein
MQNAAQREDIVEDDAVGDQVVVLDDLPLLIAVIGRDRSITSERYPLRNCFTEGDVFSLGDPQRSW